MIVADASIILEVLLRTATGQAIEERLFGSGEALHAPCLLDVEVAQVLRRYVRRGEMSPERGRLGLSLLAQLPIARHSHEPLMLRAWRLRDNITAYDAVYVVLAEALRATLLTRDAKLATATGHHAAIEVV
jgi:predicted nucleic acid-binding protein